MDIIIYDSNPDIKSIKLEVDGRRWKHPKYIQYNNENLPLWIYTYALDVIKGRWLEVEEVIKKSPRYAMIYARDIIKGRWLEGEEVIKKSPRWVCNYAEIVIGGRWLEAEETIKKDPMWWSFL